jgi:hypothetical protein
MCKNTNEIKIREQINWKEVMDVPYVHEILKRSNLGNRYHDWLN